MKSINAITKLAAIVTMMMTLSIVAAHAQANTDAGKGKLQIESLDQLSKKAAQSVNVEMDASVLKLATMWLKKDDPKEREAIEAINGLRGIYVKHLEFDTPGGYTDSDVAPIRNQLRGAAWTRIVEVVSRREGAKNAEVYLATDNGRVDGLAILLIEPKELTVVNIVGMVDIEKLRKLEGSFGVPELDIHVDTEDTPKKSRVTITTSPKTKP